jgi:hypothetical protein
LWRNAASTLTPDKSLARVDDKAKQVVGSVTLVGSLLTGLGLIAPAGLPLPPVARVFAIASVCVAVVAVVLGLSSVLLRFTPALSSGDLVEVERWFRRQFRRAYLVVAAGVLLLLAVVLAAAAAVVTLVATSSPDPLIVLQVGRTGADLQVSVRADIDGLSSGGVMRVEVIGMGTRGRTVVARGVARSSGSGSTSITVTALKVAGYKTGEVLVTVPGRRCTGSLPLEPEPASADDAVVCSGR